MTTVLLQLMLTTCFFFVGFAALSRMNSPEIKNVAVSLTLPLVFHGGKSGYSRRAKNHRRNGFLSQQIHHPQGVAPLCSHPYPLSRMHLGYPPITLSVDSVGPESFFNGLRPHLGPQNLSHKGTKLQRRFLFTNQVLEETCEGFYYWR